ncbi:MAG: dTDP-4-dehydrorhamnose reductase [Microgenomates group bacterium GW2011_GWC1_37_8]|uniref:dTDP-4-dehydrorhamnose reductase n=1 Tax=Candidatus Woesebacteria bacterium GW2011_GWB1_38_8 TaxID=1618570 RepID=A0A0G0L0J6_9BACT|nr:MAG: dTDP-4-dehydrorhamnose reductase [Microgenomates group bacterium GW2011_GWC1_37_8]KKQ84527.1 MAG: dTDP-4-dehydrorhamnose reductase [Candidatus Woesebacteria bacterium GW2011_GWB1_38_8]
MEKSVTNQKLLIIGASGFVGTKLFSHFKKEKGFQVWGTYCNNAKNGLFKLDITDGLSVRMLIKTLKPDVIILTAVYHESILSKLNKDRAILIHILGTKNVVDVCKEINAKLIYISTPLVFNGNKKFYEENDLVNPLFVYGQTKLEAEKLTQTLNTHLILRFNLIYGYNGSGFTNSLIGKLLGSDKLIVDAKHVRQPMFIDDVAMVIKKLLYSNQNGIFHLAGPHLMTKYELLSKLKESLSVDCEVIPDSTDISCYKNVTVSTKKAEDLGIKFTTLNDALVQIEKEITCKRIKFINSKGNINVGIYGSNFV